MPYKLIQNQIGGGSVEVLLLIGVLVAVYFLLVQTNLPRTVMKMVGMEKFNPNSSSVSSSQESTTTDELNRKSRPAVDLSSPGVPYQLPPARLGYSLSSDSQMTPKSVAKSVAKTVAKTVTKTVAKVTTPVSTPASSRASTPVSSRASTPVSSRASTPASSRASSSVARPVSTPKGVSTSKATVTTGKKIEKFTDVNKLYSVKDSYDLKTPLSKSVCSQKCCGYYWKQDGIDSMFKKNDPVKWSDVGVGKKYRSSNVTCMGDGVAPPGCRCYTSNQYELLATRAGNGSKQY
jgi:hypothetical protein